MEIQDCAFANVTVERHTSLTDALAGAHYVVVLPAAKGDVRTRLH